MSDKVSADMGLRYANNEVCYPATLIVGDAIKALKSGKYDLSQVAVGITQTGGQCRASNYYPIIKKALVDAGFADIPVISVSFGAGIANSQPGFKVNWFKSIPVTLNVMLFGDCLSKLYHAAVVRAENKEAVQRLRDKYIVDAKALIIKCDSEGLLRLLARAVDDFNALLPAEHIELDKVGIVGEIFLKYHPFANKFTEKWLMERGFEVIPPNMLTFFIQSFVNAQAKEDNDTDRISLPKPIMKFLYSLVRRRINKFDRVMSRFHYFTPTEDVFVLAEDVKDILPLVVQFGEGWLLPAEIVAFAKREVKAVISLQPFGCIANHIISKGLENKIKRIYPEINILSLDFDSGVSEVNIVNRLRLLLDS
jgi:predicted nucleotide-binding protein (sugar kinase/HSP70/actin superfamily)